MCDYAVVQVHQSLSVRVRVLTGLRELQPGRQLQRGEVDPRQVEQSLGLREELGGMTWIRALLQGCLEPLEKQAVT